MTESSRSWSLTDLHHVGLTVRDIEESIRFYRDTLGMTLVGRRERVTADYISKQTGYDGVEMSVASFRPNGDSLQSLEVVQYLTQAGQFAHLFPRRRLHELLRGTESKGRALQVRPGSHFRGSERRRAGGLLSRSGRPSVGNVSTAEVIATE
jgi:catechol 2,3-dioxygenase-like lactoylglutathione lyase family enzyme